MYVLLAISIIYNTIDFRILELEVIRQQMWSVWWSSYVSIPEAKDVHKVEPWLSRPHLSGTSIIQTCSTPLNALLRMRRECDRWQFRGMATVWLRSLDAVETCPTDLCTCMSAVDHYTTQILFKDYWHHKFIEKNKKFSYPDYFTCPVCQHQGGVQRGPDNRGSTVVWTRVLFTYCRNN